MIGGMGGGQTTLIQHVLDRRVNPPVEDHATATTAGVLTRLLPPPRLLLAMRTPAQRRQVERQITPDMFDCEAAFDVNEALQLMESDFRPVVVTDDLDLIRQLRAKTLPRLPYILYLAERDDARSRDAGLLAGAHDCLGQQAAEREFQARLGAVRRIAELEAALRTALQENHRLSASDDLTKVASRRFFRKHFPREVERAGRYGRPLSLLLCDIDHFKQINDTYGHPGGDEILSQFGQRLQAGLRGGVDWVARIGGEEFAVVMPETGGDQGLQVARKLRVAVSQFPFKVGARDVKVTASFGLCAADAPAQSGRTAGELMMKAADAALYRSKHDGRNRVTRATLGH